MTVGISVSEDFINKTKSSQGKSEIFSIYSINIFHFANSSTGIKKKNREACLV